MRRRPFLQARHQRSLRWLAGDKYRRVIPSYSLTGLATPGEPQSLLLVAGETPAFKLGPEPPYKL